MNSPFQEKFESAADKLEEILDNGEYNPNFGSQILLIGTVYAHQDEDEDRSSEILERIRNWDTPYKISKGV